MRPNRLCPFSCGSSAAAYSANNFESSAALPSTTSNNVGSGRIPSTTMSTSQVATNGFPQNFASMPSHPMNGAGQAHPHMTQNPATMYNNAAMAHQMNMMNMSGPAGAMAYQQHQHQMNAMALGQNSWTQQSGIMPANIPHHSNGDFHPGAFHHQQAVQMQQVGRGSEWAGEVDIEKTFGETGNLSKIGMVFLLKN